MSNFTLLECVTCGEMPLVAHDCKVAECCWLICPECGTLHDFPNNRFVSPELEENAST